MNKGKKKDRGSCTSALLDNVKLSHLALSRGDADFVGLHGLYRRVGGLRNLSAQLVGFLLRLGAVDPLLACSLE